MPNDDILARRRKVYELYTRGFTQEDIATKLGVVRQTIINDLKAIRAEGKEVLRETKEDADKELAEHIGFLNQIRSEMMREADEADKPDLDENKVDLRSFKEKILAKTIKKQYFEAALKVEEALLKLETTTGVIPKSLGDTSFGAADKMDKLADALASKGRTKLLKGLAELRMGLPSKNKVEVVDGEFKEKGEAVPVESPEEAKEEAATMPVNEPETALEAPKGAIAVESGKEGGLGAILANVAEAAKAQESAAKN